MASIIQTGPNKGYYQLPDTLITEQIPKEDSSSFGQPNLYIEMRKQQLELETAAKTGKNVFYRYSPGPKHEIFDFNNRPPFVDGFYYVRRNEFVDLRKQLYALETKRIPSSGNTEIFNTSFEDIKVPEDYCPYYIDPCPSEFEWCNQCKNKQQILLTNSFKIITAAIRWFILLVFVMIISGVIVLAIK